ncbi:MAG: aryl-sulfate sulfotransferase [Bdellovibrionales bacterium]|nr:aryl-sulfate sulfotransferase [Bdellovibrionales bacterium]
MNYKTRQFTQTFFLFVAVALLGWFGFQAPPQVARSHVQESGGDLEAGFSGELKYFDTKLSSPGFTLVPVIGAAKVLLLNSRGNVVHTWNLDADRARLLPNGNLLVVHGSKWGAKVEPWKSLRKTIREYSWAGEIVWERTESDVIHHDVNRLENGNTVFAVREMLPDSYREKIVDPIRKKIKIRSDRIVEITPLGEVSWEWKAHDHLDLNSCGKPACVIPRGKKEAQQKLSDWTHINTTSIVPANKWFDQGDSRFRPGNIITIPRNWWTVLVIDRDSKEVVWQYEGDYRGGISGGHEAHIIPEGLAGAGNMLIFDNGRKLHGNQSVVLEINPVTKEIVWLYEAPGFFSPSAGSVQRLPNGNTLISEDVDGRVFEVTQDKQVVWDYQSSLRVSRAHRYNLGYCPQFENL